ncbi:hypothetical protein ABIF26_006493 [Bradyrhizobium elkanii]|jgi:hypothetical protein|uniref:hypothetical protein n=1 Tax=Bradyrhizobium elkanii TaxID=29448 RepID=UPI0035123147
MTLEELKAKADQIKKDANAVIDGIDQNEMDEDAVNWADLSCTEVWLNLDDDKPSWMITVEEASPDSSNLAAYIHNELTRFGHDVWVRCEW